MHLRDLVETNKEGLCAIFRHCEDFPADAYKENDQLLKFLKRHKHPSTFNSRYNCKTKTQVQQEKELRNEIEDYLDRAQGYINFNTLKATEVKTLIQRHIKALGPRYEWAQKPDRKSFIEELVSNWTWYLLALIIAVFALAFPDYIAAFTLTVIAVVAILIGLVILALYYITRSKFPTAIRPEDAHVRSLAASQLRPVINEMTAAAPLKYGRTRRYFYATALRFVATIGKSKLEVPTVSNIRWLVVNRRRRLLFLSSYSNTTDFYVREFLTGSTPRGVNFMFTNGNGFPDARWMIKGGISKDPEGYMNVIHTHQHITHLWYAHDYELTVDIVKRNGKVRNGLFRPMSEKRAREWLRLL